MYSCTSLGRRVFIVCVPQCLAASLPESPRWRLNPGPSDYKTDALPLSIEALPCLCDRRRPWMLLVAFAPSAGPAGRRQLKLMWPHVSGSSRPMPILGVMLCYMKTIWRCTHMSHQRVKIYTRVNHCQCILCWKKLASLLPREKFCYG